MHKEENKVIVQTAKKLGINPTNEIISRCSEFLRLLQLKPSIISSTNDASRTVICLDLATQYLGTQESLEASELLKCSGLKKSAYLNTKRMLEKSLDLNHKVGINEICLKHGISEAKKLATDILNKYKSYCSTTDKSNDDFSHPQYSAIAVFSACKKLKVKIQKQKLVGESLLKPQQWTALEKRFEKVLEMEDTKKKGTEVTKKDSKMNEEVLKEVDPDRNSKKRPLTDNKEEDYEHWKTRILKKAYRDLELLKKKEQEA
ncbi:origin recognition complex subunit 6 [Culicoides brevitarsis]|uniref:origin recognition complex subunit 6 n=1 Tax=Culicoides brevitarsis TaxID=469753 RepID=UPI00307C05CD